MANAPIVTIQLGQCGNQVGAAFFEQMSQQLMQPEQAAETGRSGTAARFEPTPPEHRSAFQRGIASRFFRNARRRPADGTAAAAGSAAASSASGSAAASASAGLPVARAVLLDMEPKVIRSAYTTAAQSGSFAYDARRSFARQSGSGNNWAFGYSKHGLECREPMLDLVRKEIESCPSLGGVLLMTSLAGGTGSGVGASLAEALRDTYPSTSMLNQVIWPYTQGEVIVQNYNALLTLAHLQEYSDGLLVFENDSLATICTRRLQRATPSFPEMNDIIAKSLVQAFAPAVITQAQPFYCMPGEREDASASVGGGGGGGGSTLSSRSKTKHDSSSSGSSSSSGKPKFVAPSDASLLASCPPLHLWSDALSTLFPHPSLKLSTLRCIPQVSSAALAFQSNSWGSLLRAARQMLLTNHAMEDGLDWSVGSEAGALTRDTTKRKWHQHYSASARAVRIYDVGTSFDSAGPTVAAAAAAGSPPFPASAAAGSSSSFDQPLPPPSHLAAFVDGESFLEYRLRGELEAQRTRQERAAAYGEALDGADSAAAAADGPAYSRSLAQIVFLRGSAVCSADARPFLDPSLYTPAALSPLAVARSGALARGGSDRAVSLWCNGQSVLAPLDALLSKVDRMLRARAYTHHYRKYGVELEDMWQRVLAIEEVAAEYRALTYQPD